jgi:hypothetical protein
MDAFGSFSAGTWLVISLFCFILSLLVLCSMRWEKVMRSMKMKRRLRFKKIARKCFKKRKAVKRTIDVVIGNLVDQHSAYSSSIRKSIALLVFAVFSFYICFFFASMIKTEMVVQKRPPTISTYADIVNNPRIKPVWAKGLNDHWDFMNAKPGTIEAQVWEKAKRFGIENCRVQGDFQALIKYGIDVGLGNSVFLGSSYIMDLVITNACYLSRKYGTLTQANAWLRSDPNARETLNGFMRSTAVSKRTAKRLAKSGQNLFEFQIIKQAIKQLNYVMGKDTGSKGLRDCVANVIIYPDHALVFPDLIHYHKLFLLLVASSFVAAFVLAIECGIKWRVRKRKVSCVNVK